MSGMKNEMERLEDMDRQAVDTLLKRGAITECPFHEGIYIDQMDGDAVAEAQKLGSQMVKRGKVDGTADEFKTAIDNAVANTGEKCGMCAKNRDD